MAGATTGRHYQDLLVRGTVLEDRYEVQRVIGQGGMSTVYAARDLRFSHVERLCAVKEMFIRERDDHHRVSQISNFEREAALLATLSHPAIPKIYDYFSRGGLVYLVLEFVDGTDLERLLGRSDEPLSEQTLIDWALQILDVLSYLHEHQPDPIVFRDLKPSNVMLRTDGTITLIDFGIARTFQPMQRGTMIGTEGYAPPEQYRGTAEPRGDIYALGATLHHLSTQVDPRTEPPFTFDQHPVRAVNPALSEGFEQVVRRATAYAPADRFPSAAAMAQALSEIRPFDTEVPRVGVTPPRPQPPTRAPISLPAIATTIEPVTERIVWSVQTGDEVRGTAAITAEHAFIGSYDQHLYALSLADGGILWRFRANRGVIARPLISDDLVIVGAEDHVVYALRAGTGRLAWTFRTAMPVRSSAAGYNDALVVGSDDGYCYCLDAHQGNLLWRQRAWGPIRSSPLINDDLVFVGSDDGSVHCFTATDGRPRWRAPLGRPVMSSPAMASQVLVVGGTDGGLHGLDIRSGARRWTLDTQGPLIASPRLVGDLVIIGSTDGALYAVSALDGRQQWKQQVANQITATAAIDGGRAYVATVDGNVLCVALEDGETIWSHRIGSPIASSPVLGGGVLIVGALDGKIYGLRP
ncbi:MAG TPA: serine/threonine-protein kinase [Thermomicrobiaceae bacterium]|nr:serine/threonine-protein kinase [Thermomicrobiaceae bacterium]